MDKTFFTRSISRRGDIQVYATLHDGRVAIEKIWLAESTDAEDVASTRRQAGREADTMRRLAVQRDADGRVVSNNNFIFSCRVVEGEDRTTLRMDTEAGWTAEEYRLRWREGRHDAGADRLPPDDFPQDTMPWTDYLARVLDIMEETAYALRCIHSVRPAFLHCDIKPANLWVQAGQHPLERMGGVRLIDFGSAFSPRELDGARTPQALLDGFRHVGGTPGFWSPAVQDAYLRLCDLQNACSGHTPDMEDRADDCRRALKALGPADDVYSLTATFLWMLTGQVPEDRDDEELRGVIEGSMEALPAAVGRAAADCILGLFRLCAGAEPPADCDDRMIHELEMLRDIAGCTGLYPETLRQCAAQWWSVWSRLSPARPRDFLEKRALPVLSEKGTLLDAAELAWCASTDSLRTFSLKILLEHGKKKDYAIVGDSGIGKTCLLCYTFRQLLNAPRIVPLYLPLERLDLSVPDAILHFLGEQVLSYLRGGPLDGPAALRRLFATETRYHFYLFLDHLDPILCRGKSPLEVQIRELCAFDSVKVITMGVEPPPLGLPVVHAIPRKEQYPYELTQLQEEKNWYLRLARFRLCQTVLPYPQYKIFMALDRDSQRTVTAAQMNVLWLYDQMQACAGETDPATVQTVATVFFPALCAGLFCQNTLRFGGEFCAPYLPEQLRDTAQCLSLLVQMGLLDRRGEDWGIAPATRDFGAALYYAWDKTAEEDRTAELRECLYHTRADPGAVLYSLAELSPRHPMLETVSDGKMPDAARAFLARMSPRHSVLDKLLELCSDRHTAVWKMEGQYMAPAVLFQAWVYERDGDLSGCDLRQLDPALLNLHHARLLGTAGPAILPEQLALSSVALLPLPEPLRCMDWREDYLLVAGEREAVVFTPWEQRFCLALDEDCRRIACAALCLEAGRIEVFAEVPGGFRYLLFDLATGASIPAGNVRFSSDRMFELCRLRDKKEEAWLTTDRQYRLALRKIMGRRYLVAMPRFSAEEGDSLPEDTRILWEVAPCALSGKVRLPYGDLRMECGAHRITLYDIRQGETLWTERRARLWEMVRMATPELIHWQKSGAFALLPDGFVFEIQHGMGLPIQLPGYRQQYWLIFCDRHGVPQHYARYDMNHYGLVEEDRWPKDLPEEEKRAFQEEEKSPAAPLNHRVYAKGKLYLRSDLKPYLIAIIDLKTGKVEQLVNSSVQVEALAHEGDRVVAVCIGRKKGFLLSGTAEEIRRTVPLQNLLSSYRRYTSRRQALLPFVVSPVTAQQARAFAPPARPGDPPPEEDFLQDHLITETVVV